jgi:integrase
LQREDYNPLAATLTVSKSIDSKGRAQATKNRRTRIVPLAPRVVAALNGHIEREQPTGALFTSPTGCRLSGTNFAARVWRPAREKAGVQARFHDLRHSCASWLLAGGATTAEVRDMLGHSSITVTEAYLHTDPTTLAATVTRALA